MTPHSPTFGKLRNSTTAAFLGFVFLSASIAHSQTAPAQTAPDTNPAETAFKTNCAMCHGPDGAGTPFGKRVGAPDLRAKEVQALSSAALAKIVTDGKNNMPAFGARMDSAQISALIEYIRKFHPAPTTPAAPPSTQ